MGFHEIKPGYVGRWIQQTFILLRRGFALNLLAIATIIAVFFFVPQWSGMSLLSAYLLLVILIAVARQLDNGASLLSSIRLLLPPTMKLVVFLLFVGIAVQFVFSGVFIDLKHPDQSIFFEIDRVALYALGSVATNLEMAAEYPDQILQNPLMPMLVYIGAARGVLPALSLEYLITLSMTFRAIMLNIAPTLLLLIIAEFILRSQTVIGTAMTDHHGMAVEIFGALFMGISTWISSLWMYFYLREMIDGEINVGKGPRKETGRKQLALISS